MGGIVAWIQQHTALAVVVVLGLIIGIAFIRKQTPGATSAATTSTGDYSGLATDASGNKLVYVPVTDTFYNSSTVTGSYNSHDPAAPIEHPIAPPATPLLAIVRAKGNSTLTGKYDAKNPQGIPIRATPDGKVISYAPYGSQLALANKNITTGATNLPGGAGSDQWFSANGGFVSAYDLTGFVA
mgnify:CR=1 FL=1